MDRGFFFSGGTRMTKNRFLIAALTAAAVVLTAAALAALLLAACEQTGAPAAAESPGVKPSSPGTGTGTVPGADPLPTEGKVTVTVAARDPGEEGGGVVPSFVAFQSLKSAVSPGLARTVVPVVSGSFDEITVIFKSGETTTNRDMSNAAVDGDTITKTFYLPPGDYTLTIEAIKNGDTIALGTAAVTVTLGTPKDALVILTPDDNPDLADGTFGYDVTLPDEFIADYTATLTLTDPQGGTVQTSGSVEVKPINLTSIETEGAVKNLRPGEYLLAVFLEQGEGESKISHETVYIYSGLESTYKRDLSGITLVKTKGTLNLTISFGPSTIVNEDTDTLTFRQNAASTFTLTVPTKDFEETAWYLDGALATDGVADNVYTAPGTLMPGTHFVTASAKALANGKTYSQIVEFLVEEEE
jgi:hypothetical protein